MKKRNHSNVDFATTVALERANLKYTLNQLMKGRSDFNVQFVIIDAIKRVT